MAMVLAATPTKPSTVRFMMVVLDGTAAGAADVRIGEMVMLHHPEGERKQLNGAVPSFLCWMNLKRRKEPPQFPLFPQPARRVRAIQPTPSHFPDFRILPI